MRTVQIDDNLLEEAMAVTGLATQEATVEAALCQMISRKRLQEALRSTAGIGWDGDLEAIRRDKVTPAS